MSGLTEDKAEFAVEVLAGQGVTEGKRDRHVPLAVTTLCVEARYAAQMQKLRPHRPTWAHLTGHLADNSAVSQHD